MSLTRQVASLIQQRGDATADDLLPSLPGRTRAQVLRALGNAAYLGLLECHRRWGEVRGSPPSVYRPRQAQPCRKPVASVWELGR